MTRTISINRAPVPPEVREQRKKLRPKEAIRKLAR